MAHTCSNNIALFVYVRQLSGKCYSSEMYVWVVSAASLSNLITSAYRQTAIRGTTRFADIVA